MKVVHRHIVLFLITVLLVNVLLNLALSRNAFSDHDVIMTSHSYVREDTDGEVEENLVATPTSNAKQHLYYNNSSSRSNLSSLFYFDLMPTYLRQSSFFKLPVTITAEDFRKHPNLRTGNPLIDLYGHNDMMLSGEFGKAVTFNGKEKEEADTLRKIYNLNVKASDVIPLNRLVPDSRLDGCENVTYADDMPTTSVIIPFYDEWPSVLLRTVYSLINRTPRHLLQEIILVDDNSTLEELGEPLEQYIKDYFPQGFVRLLRMRDRQGLIRARMEGWRASVGKVVAFFDSHIEVNIQWLEPLLHEIRKDRATVAMSTLDYIDRDTLEYRYNVGHIVRYGFGWHLGFFETYFNKAQLQKYSLIEPKPGVVMVGHAFAMDRAYFSELGGYDEGMTVWGGENLEMAWRVWLSGGRLMHVPCSHTGHIARGQPYSFPGGRGRVEHFNYKRAMLVWMPEFQDVVYDVNPDMKDLEVGDLSERYRLRDRIKRHNFTWYIDNVWPELLVYSRDVQAWGSLVNLQSKKCLDNHSFLFSGPVDLKSFFCHHHLNTQGFSLTMTGQLRTTLHCVVYDEGRPRIQDCFDAPANHWTHTKNGPLVHVESKLCLDQHENDPVMSPCQANMTSQYWSFTKYVTL